MTPTPCPTPAQAARKPRPGPTAIALLNLVLLNLALLLAHPAAQAAPATAPLAPCHYLAGADTEITEAPRCLNYQPGPQGDGQVAASVLRRAHYDRHGLGVLFAAQGPFYFTRAGRLRLTLPFDNGPDDFVQGLARTRREGRVGFINPRLEIVIPPAYDFAFPFDASGLALVCQGCREERQGEHGIVTGGRWGAIDRRGQVRVPITETGPARVQDRLPEP